MAYNGTDNGSGVTAREGSGTMTYEEIKAAVQRLPVAERLRLAEEITDSVRGTWTVSLPTANGDNKDDAAWRTEFEAERARLLEDIPADSSLHRLLGIARIREKIPMTKEEDRQVILEYLTEKYGS